MCYSSTEQGFTIRDFKEIAVFVELENFFTPLMNILLDKITNKTGVNFDYPKQALLGWIDSGACIYVPTAEIQMFDTVRKGLMNCFGFETVIIPDHVKEATKIIHRGIHVYANVSMFSI